jgi:7-cyano-7-deazaguanine synthase in queuosine biosynthesis
MENHMYLNHSKQKTEIVKAPVMRVSKMQILVHKKSLSPPKKHAVRYNLEEKSECDY